MLLWSTRVNKAVFAVFGVLEITEIILFAGFFLAGAGKSVGADVIKIGGYVGVLTALVAWYTSAAVVANNMAGRSCPWDSRYGPRARERLPPRSRPPAREG